MVGWILAFPVLMVLAGSGPRSGSMGQAAIPVLLVETVLLGGLMGAARERRRLWNERAAGASARRAVPAAPTTPTRRAAAAPRPAVGR
jgi:hypothetical protein